MRTIHVTLAALSLSLGLATALSVSARVSGGRPAKSDCYAELDGVTATKVHPNPIVECTDGDVACDADGACNGSCRFDVRVCVNQDDVVGCAPPPGGLRRLTVSAKGAKPAPPAQLDGSACGAFTSIDVPLKSKAGGKKILRSRYIIQMLAKPQKGVVPTTDVDKITLTCLPKVGGCETTTTIVTTTSTTLETTTTTTLP